MTTDDLEQIIDVASDAFRELDEHFGVVPGPPPDRALRRARFARPLSSDPGGGWVADDGGRIVGAAQAIDRDGLWGLSLLVVQPGLQSRGTGRALLDRALAYAGGGRRGGIIVASQDPRALRLYASAGFDLDPAVAAAGRVRVPPAVPDEVREGGRADLASADAVGRAVRGVGHGEDLAAMLEAGFRLLVVPDRGFVTVRDGHVGVLAARDEETAAGLLRAALAEAGDGEAEVGSITGRQQWAMRVVVDAGLPLRFEGAILTRGDVGPFHPYLPSGAYL